jgi:hypothetical protein
MPALALMRFRIEETIGRTWLVWDEVTEDVTVVDGTPAMGFSKEMADRSAKKLNKLDHELRRFRQRG